MSSFWAQGEWSGTPFISKPKTDQPESSEPTESKVSYWDSKLDPAAEFNTFAFVPDVAAEFQANVAKNEAEERVRQARQKVESEYSDET